MALLKFLKGNYSALSNAAINEGQILICGDTGEMFVDVAADKRVKIGDFVVMSDIASLEALDASSVPTSRLYYVEDGNILARSNGTSWIQINKQKTLAELGGVSKTIYDEKVAALVKADSDNATATSNLATYVGTIPETAEATNIVAYIQEKTAGIATDTALEELTGRVATAEGEIDALQAAIGEDGSITSDIADAKAAGDAAQADVDALELKVGTIAEGKTVAGLIADAQTQADKGVEDAAAAKARADEAYTLADGKATMDEVNAAIAGAGHAVKSEVDAALEQLGKDYAAADTALETKLQGNIDKKVDQNAYDTKVAELAGADTTLQGNIDALAGKVGTVPEGQTVMGIITTMQENAYDDTEVRGLIGDNADAIEAIEKDYLKAADKTELQDQITANANAIELLTNGVSADEVDGVNDLIQYVKDHGTEVTGMQESIAANAKAIADQATSDAATYETKTDAAQKLADAKAYTDTEVAKDRERLEAIEGKVDVEKVSTAISDAVAVEKARAEGKEAELLQAIEDAKTDASNKDAVVLAEAQKGINAVQGNVDAVAERVTTAEGKITDLETESAKHALKTEVEAVQSALDEYEEANDAAVALKADASVVEAMDTAYKAADTALSGRIEKLENNDAGYATTGAVATAKSEAISAAEAKATELDNALKTALQAEIDADVKALADGQVATNKTDIATLMETMTWGSF